MKRNLDKYKDLKNSLINNTLNMGKNKTDQDYMRLLKLTSIEPEVKETLLLLHSNYKAELKELQTELNTITLKHLDNSIDVVEELHKRIDTIDTKLDNLIGDNKNKMILGIISIDVLQKIFFIIGGMMLLFFILYVIDKEAFLAVYNHIRDLFGIVGLKSNTTT